MNSHILCIFALFALPNVLAISCYKCTPGEGITCARADQINITNCDMDPDVPKGMADACTKVSTVMAMGSTKIAINQMGCGMKAMCSAFKAKVCNASDLPSGMTLEKCEANCCDQDKCNGLGENNDGCFNAASFVAIIISVMALHAGVFIH